MQGTSLHDDAEQTGTFQFFFAHFFSLNNNFFQVLTSSLNRHPAILEVLPCSWPTLLRGGLQICSLLHLLLQRRRTEINSQNDEAGTDSPTSRTTDLRSFLRGRPSISSVTYSDLKTHVLPKRNGKQAVTTPKQTPSSGQITEIPDDCVCESFFGIQPLVSYL